jgi:hypothetical protein
MKRLLLLASIALALAMVMAPAPSLLAAPPGQSAEKATAANAALLSGHPLDALAGYRELLDAPQFARVGSPELWCNRGFAEEKTGDPAVASLSFRRALLLDPGFVPAQRQLAVVLGTLGLPAPSPGKARLFKILSPEVMILGGATLGWIGLFLIVVLLVHGPHRKAYVVTALLALLLGHGVSVFGSFVDPRRTAGHEAVVTAKKAPALRSTPADSATTNGTLSPGTLITILSRNGAWWYVSSGSGMASQKGWILSDAATPLLPASCAFPSKG